MESYRTAIIILLIVGVCTMVEAKYMKYKDPRQPLNKRISDVLSRMTLAEKVGQMSQIERKYAFPEVMKNYFIGSVLSGGGSTPSYRASAKIWVDMVNTMQKGALSTRLGIPFMYGIDAVHGQNTAYGATIFPHNVGLGVTRDPALVKKIGEATALEVRATGIPYIFAPCVAVCRDPRWGRCYESYSEDTKIVEDMTDFIYGLQGEIPANSRKGVPYIGGKTKVAACAKHYVGDGGTNKGINGNNTLLNQHKLLSIHMSPYYHSIIKGVSTVMLSYSSWNGVKMHANKFLITDFLKNQLRFRGFVTTDWQGIDNILPQNKQNYTYSVLTGINAGIDMVMIPYDYPDFVSNLTYLVENNFIAMSRINDAVRRILRVKFTLGLFENPYADLSLADQIGKKEHRELAREAVRKSLVLLKNGKIGQKPILPLPKNMNKLFIAGTHAHNLGYQCGGWTIEWQGQGGNNLTIGTTLLEAMKSTVSPSTEILYSEFPDTEYIKKIKDTVSYAIVAVGEYPYAETAGDNFTLEMAETGPDTIKSVCTYIKCVVIVMSGRPIVLEPYVNVMDALVAAWLPGSEGKGITDVLFGDFGFTGKLARTWFKSVDQLPMNVGDPHYDPLYPFGYGLTT